MGNIIDYVKQTADIPFEEAPFVREDALVLSQFCYLKFEGLVGDDSAPVSLKEIDIQENKESLFCIKNNEKDNRKLYAAILESKRFSDMKLAYYVSRVDVEAESQFAAITFLLPNDNVYVAFRGTDETMAGWQEDVALALKRPILGQMLSAAYLNTVVGKLKGRVFVGGHSKGGNLAMYASLCAKKSVKKKIETIFCFDGPGFRPEFLEDLEYEDIKKKLVQIMPKSSPVGLILNAPGEYEIIEAKSVGFLQHNIYNWVIKDNLLVNSEMTEQHLLAMRSMNEWILSLDDEGLENFVGFLCWLLDATEATTTEEFKANVALHTKALLKAGQNFDDATKEMISNFSKSYFELAGGLLKEEVQEKYDEFVKGMDERYEAVRLEFMEKTEEAKEMLEETKEKIEKTIASKRRKPRKKKEQ